MGPLLEVGWAPVRGLLSTLTTLNRIQDDLGCIAILTEDEEDIKQIGESERPLSKQWRNGEEHGNCSVVSGDIRSHAAPGVMNSYTYEVGIFRILGR